MKITCPTCSARYSIDDAKVKGKAFKFTCKKCGQAHVYRASAEAEAPVETQAPGGYAAPAQPGPDDPIWHVAVGEEQQGPYTTNQILDYIRSNQIDPESSMWKEGMDDWLPVGEIPEFAEAYAAAGAAMAAQQQQQQQFPAEAGGYPPELSDDQATTISPFSAMTDAMPAGDAGDLFSFGAPGAPAQRSAAQAADQTPGPFSAFSPQRGAQAAVAGRRGADLFGGPQASPFEGGAEDREEDVLTGGEPAHAAAGPSPRVDAPQMIGQRNENSILFSLASLQALAGAGARAGGAAPAASFAGAASGRAGFASGEGSGLIDIRAVVAGPKRDEDKPDDIFRLGGGGVAAPVAVPVLMKPVRRDDESRRPMYILVGVIGTFAIAIVVLLVVLLGREKERVVIQQVGGTGETDASATTVAQASATEEDAGTAEEKEAAGGEPVKEETDAGEPTEAGAGEPADSGEPVKAVDGEEEPERDAGAAGRPNRGGGPGVRRDVGGAATPPSEREDVRASRPPPERDAGSRPDRQGPAGDLESVLGGRRDSGSSASSSGCNQGGPVRTEVQGALEGRRGAVRACTGGQSGAAQATVVFQGSTGRVSNVRVDGDFTGQAATCIANALRSVSVGCFTNPTQTVNYTYRF